MDCFSLCTLPMQAWRTLGRCELGERFSHAFFPFIEIVSFVWEVPSYLQRKPIATEPYTTALHASRMALTTLFSISNAIDEKDLRPGDHIYRYIDKTPAQHHGIVISVPSQEYLNILGPLLDNVRIMEMTNVWYCRALLWIKEVEGFMKWNKGWNGSKKCLN